MAINGGMIGTDVQCQDALTKRVFSFVVCLSFLTNQIREICSYYIHPHVILHLSLVVKNS